MGISPDAVAGVGTAVTGIEGAGLMPPPMPDIDINTLTPPPESLAEGQALEADIENFTNPNYNPIQSIESLAAEPLLTDATPLPNGLIDSDDDPSKKHSEGKITDEVAAEVVEEASNELKNGSAGEAPAAAATTPAIGEVAQQAATEKPPVQPATKLEDPGAFDEVAVRTKLDADYQTKGLTNEEKNARVNEAKAEHDKKKSEYDASLTEKKPEGTKTTEQQKTQLD